MADFIFPGTNCEYHTAEMSRSETLLKSAGENFLSQVLRELTRKDAFLDLLVVNGEGLMGDGMVLVTVTMKWLSLKLSV